MSMPDSARFSWSVSRISPVPPPNSVWNATAEIGVDGLEGLGEFLARNLVDLLDGLLGVANGIDQVLPLRAQEILALLRFLELLHGRRVHRSQRLDAVAHFGGRLLGFGDGVRRREPGRRPAARSSTGQFSSLRLVSSR